MRVIGFEIESKKGGLVCKMSDKKVNLLLQETLTMESGANRTTINLAGKPTEGKNTVITNINRYYSL